jgi:hypothetical protein
MDSSSKVTQQIAALTSGAGAKAARQKVALQGMENAVSGQKQFMTRDEFAAYLHSGVSYIEALEPVGYREEQIVQKIIDANWQLNRSGALDNNLLNASREENSARSERLTDVQTEAMLSQAFGFRDECGQSDAFDVLSRFTERAARVFVEMNRELDRVQENRLQAGSDRFALAECRMYAWYAAQSRKLDPGAALKSFSAG